MRTAITKHISKPIEFKSQLLHWTNQFREVVFLDSNEYQQAYSSYDCIVAVDAFTSITTDYQNAFEDLYQYQSHTNDWLFGYLSYDLKNDTEDLQSHNFDGLDFPDLFFFQPKKIFFLKGNELIIHYLNLCDDEVEEDFETISTIEIPISLSNLNKPIIKQRVSKESYLQKTQKMLDYIHLGSIYEANFCMEFYAEKAPIDPIIVYEKLDAISEPPFATFFKNKDQYLLSASPERYLKKVGEKVISQPIKGTARRSFDVEQDAFLKKELMNSEKERSENIMIVDLVRNDLSHTATKGSVVVEELCKVYTFQHPMLHQ